MLVDLNENRFIIDDDTNDTILEFDSDLNENVEMYVFANTISWRKIHSRLNALYDENKKLKEELKSQNNAHCMEKMNKRFTYLNYDDGTQSIYDNEDDEYYFDSDLERICDLLNKIDKQYNGNISYNGPSQIKLARLKDENMELKKENGQLKQQVKDLQFDVLVRIHEAGIIHCCSNPCIMEKYFKGDMND